MTPQVVSHSDDWDRAFPPLGAQPCSSRHSHRRTRYTNLRQCMSSYICAPLCLSQEFSSEAVSNLTYAQVIEQGHMPDSQCSQLHCTSQDSVCVTRASAPGSTPQGPRPWPRACTPAGPAMPPPPAAATRPAVASTSLLHRLQVLPEKHLRKSCEQLGVSSAGTYTEFIARIYAHHECAAALKASGEDKKKGIKKDKKGKNKDKLKGKRGMDAGPALVASSASSSDEEEEEDTTASQLESMRKELKKMQGKIDGKKKSEGKKSASVDDQQLTLMQEHFMAQALQEARQRNLMAVSAQMMGMSASSVIPSSQMPLAISSGLCAPQGHLHTGLFPQAMPVGTSALHGHLHSSLAQGPLDHAPQPQADQHVQEAIFTMQAQGIRAHMDQDGDWRECRITLSLDRRSLVVSHSKGHATANKRLDLMSLRHGVKQKCVGTARCDGEQVLHYTDETWCFIFLSASLLQTGTMPIRHLTQAPIRDGGLHIVQEKNMPLLQHDAQAGNEGMPATISAVSTNEDERKGKPEASGPPASGSKGEGGVGRTPEEADHRLPTGMKPAPSPGPMAILEPAKVRRPTQPAQPHPKLLHMRFWIPVKDKGRVIGRGGQQVKKLLAMAGAKNIDVQRDHECVKSDPEREVRITALKQSQLDKARDLILEVVSAARGPDGMLKMPQPEVRASRPRRRSRSRTPPPQAAEPTARSSATPRADPHSKPHGEDRRRGGARAAKPHAGGRRKEGGEEVAVLQRRRPSRTAKVPIAQRSRPRIPHHSFIPHAVAKHMYHAMQVHAATLAVAIAALAVTTFCGIRGLPGIIALAVTCGPGLWGAGVSSIHTRAGLRPHLISTHVSQYQLIVHASSLDRAKDSDFAPWSAAGHFTSHQGRNETHHMNMCTSEDATHYVHLLPESPILATFCRGKILGASLSETCSSSKRQVTMRPGHAHDCAAGQEFAAC